VSRILAATATLDKPGTAPLRCRMTEAIKSFGPACDGGATMLEARATLIAEDIERVTRGEPPANLVA
jgi:hypothetical protein